MESERQSQLRRGDERGVQKRSREDSQQSEETCCIYLRSLLGIKTNIVPCLTNLIQKLFREEWESRLCQRPTINQTEISGAKFFKLVFENELPVKIFTQSKIKAKDKTHVKVALYDIRSQSIVADGPLSSTKIQICVLDGEFGSDGSEESSSEKFNAKIIRQRENKGQLLKGDTVITLQNGVCYITEVEFTDNSSWTRSGRFRLGAKVVQSNFNGTKIREGISKPFKVKDNRGELNQKHYPPSPNDEIWRLTKISKNGVLRRRLSLHGIHTVKDLLHLHETDPSSLQEKFGNTPKKQRETIIEHAKTCDVEYRSRDTLNSDEKLTSAQPSPFATLQSAAPRQCAARNLEDLQTLQQDQQEKRLDPCQPSTSTMHVGEGGLDDRVNFMELLTEGACVEGNVFSLIGSHIPSLTHDADSTMDAFSDFQFANDTSFRDGIKNVNNMLWTSRN